MNGFLKNGLLVVGGVVLGSMVTQKAIVDTLHSKEIAMRQNWRECQEVLFENRKGADDVLDNLRWVDVASGRKNRLYPEWIRHRAAESDVSQITRRRHNGGIPQQFPQRTGKIDRYCCRKDGEKTG